MAASASRLRPAKVMRTASSCKPETARGTHVFTVNGYSLHGVDAAANKDNFIRSAAFDVGGFDWCLRYYHNGNVESGDDYISVFLELMTKDAEVKTIFDIRMLDQYTDSSCVLVSTRNNTRRVFSTTNFNSKCLAWGSKNFIRRSELESSVYLRDDRLMIECNLTVIKTPLVKTEERAVMPSDIIHFQVPHTNLSRDLGKLLDANVGADLSFNVGGEVFTAHSVVLAARSPVFMAEFYGPMRAERGQQIVIQDVQPVVFKALLHFMYTDSFSPAVNHDLSRDEWQELVKHLLIAADRYAVEGLKTICENALCKSLSVDNVATIVALADQHNCSRLKEACVTFIASPNRLDDVSETEGYGRLKTSCPSILLDVIERATKSRKIN
uniref:BTB domain-containing protein n=1 Tax=Oryza punctata TaxID=4537 RepID=A0A0E0LSJ2_ORYPU